MEGREIIESLLQLLGAPTEVLGHIIPSRRPTGRLVISVEVTIVLLQEASELLSNHLGCFEFRLQRLATTATLAAASHTSPETPNPIAPGGR